MLEHGDDDVCEACGLKMPARIDRHHAYIDLIKIDLESRNGNFEKDTQESDD